MISFNQLKKNLRQTTDNLKPVRLAVLSDNASQLTVQALKGYGVEVGIDFIIYEADYDQIDQEVFNIASELYQFKPDFVFINFSTQHLIKRFYKCGRDIRQEFSVSELRRIRALSDTISSQMPSKIILNNFVEINDNVFGQFAAKERKSFIYQTRSINLGLMDLCQESPAIFISDFQSLQSQLGQDVLFDAKMYIGADMAYSIEFLPFLAKAVSDIVLSISGTFKKCVVLDLDNTVWGGIIGDDGMEGIQIGSLGLGKAFSEFQYWLKELKARGIVLAVCSKNTEEIAKEPFEAHPDMVLRLTDIAVFVANWENKVDNIRYIQQVLNIGFDSMVFLDDNKFEREMVKQGIPELSVPEMPEDPAEYMQFLRSLNLFETASFTEEDENRTQLYQEEVNRTQLQQKFANEDEFLQNLDMKATVKPVDNFTAPRVAQLTQRSNQFNLRTIRYSEHEILELATSPDYFSYSLNLEDKFGNHGLISAIILKKLDEKSLFIDTWIMSCRVLKRGMEKFTLSTIVKLAAENNFTCIVGEYLPTKKNIIVKDHYADLGFSRLDEHTWILDIKNYSPVGHYITIL